MIGGAQSHATPPPPQLGGGGTGPAQQWQTKRVPDAPSADSTQPVPAAVRWPDVPGLPSPANQFVISLSPGQDGSPELFDFSFGWVSGPYFVGTPQEQAEQARAAVARGNGRLELFVHPVARFVMTRERAAQLQAALGEMISQYDASPPSGSQP